MNPSQTDYPLRIFMLSVLLGMACLTVPWPALATGLGVLTAHFLRWVPLASVVKADKPDPRLHVLERRLPDWPADDLADLLAELDTEVTR